MKELFPADVRAPARARSFVRAVFTDLLGTGELPRRDDVLLVVSELVTNAVRAGAGTVEVELRVHRREFQLNVVDDATGWPAPRDATNDDLGGRGLAIVERLADRWQTRPQRRGTGKTVTVTWFR